MRNQKPTQTPPFKGSIVFTKDSRLGQLFELFPRGSKELQEASYIMRCNGMECIGYGIDHGSTIRECVKEQCVNEQQLDKILRGINKIASKR